MTSVTPDYGLPRIKPDTALTREQIQKLQFRYETGFLGNNIPNLPKAPALAALYGQLDNYFHFLDADKNNKLDTAELQKLAALDGSRTGVSLIEANDFTTLFRTKIAPKAIALNSIGFEANINGTISKKEVQQSVHNPKLHTAADFAKIKQGLLDEMAARKVDILTLHDIEKIAARKGNTGVLEAADVAKEVITPPTIPPTGFDWNQLIRLLIQLLLGGRF